jgi:hypothetical protein
MSLYLQARFGFTAKINDPDADAHEMAHEAQKTVKKLVASNPNWKDIGLEAIGLNDGYGLTFSIELSHGDGIYSGECFDEAALVRPFETADGSLIESRSDDLRDALKYLIALVPAFAELAWIDQPKRFFTVTS